MRRFELAIPDSVEACLKTLAQRGADAKLLAGGTDLLPQLKNHLLKPAYVVDLSGVADLRVLDGDAKGGLPGLLGERRAGGIDPGAQPGHRGWQHVQRRALG